MKKSVAIFLIAVLLPSAILGFLALRNAQEQQIILERRTAELYQSEADNTAAAIRSIIDDQRRAFTDSVRQLLLTQKPEDLAKSFAPSLAKVWPRNAVGFALDRNGNLLSPSAQEASSRSDWQRFLTDNTQFVSNQMVATIFPVAVEDLNRPEPLRKNASYEQRAISQRASMNSSYPPGKLESRAGKIDESTRKLEPAASAPTSSDKLASSKPTDSLKDRFAEDSLAMAGEGKQAKGLPPVRAPKPIELPAEKPKGQPDAATTPPTGSVGAISAERAGNAATVPAPAAGPLLASAPAGVAAPPLPADDSLKSELAANAAPQTAESAIRNVAPQQILVPNERAAYSQLTWATVGFKDLTIDKPEGMITRFVRDHLEMILWLRPEQAPHLVFGCRIEAESLRDLWPMAFPSPYPPAEFLLTLLDDKARPVTDSSAFTTTPDWKHPFVASEIGEVLPHWEVALYLTRPEQLRENARAVRHTFLLLVATALGAIACGGWLIVADARRQLALAQQKTDFVSNVSHELKTPLTSIRMFAELMQSGRADPIRHPQYLRIIMVESERLTRLINNVLDFAKLGRNRKPLARTRLDLHAVIARTWEGQQLHLQENGFQTQWQATSPPYPVDGDEDAIAQILVNLLSNAEKYSGTEKTIEIQSYLDGASVCVSVLDRGSGIPAGEEKKIFEPFYRAHDSLASGIQGSGLGLTLSLRHARELGGDILYQARPDGGSLFTLRLPLAESTPFPLS